MKSDIIKRSIIIEGHKTSVSLEETFWHAMKEIEREQGQTLSALVASIKAGRGPASNLSSAIRVHVLHHLRSRVSASSPRAQERVHAGSKSQGPHVG